MTDKPDIVELLEAHAAKENEITESETDVYAEVAADLMREAAALIREYEAAIADSLELDVDDNSEIWFAFSSYRSSPVLRAATTRHAARAAKALAVKSGA